MSICAISRYRVQRFCSLLNTAAKKTLSVDPVLSHHGCKLDRIVLPSATIIQEHGYKKMLKKITYKKLKPIEFKSVPTRDLVQQEPLPPTEMHYLYKDIKALEDAPEELRKLFTVEFATGREKLQHRQLICQERISNVVGCDQNLEKYIGFLTVKIRNMLPYVLAIRQNKRAKVLLKEKIEKRQKLLKQLSKHDYDRFVWLLKELKINYKPHTKETVTRLTKREKIRKAVEDKMKVEKTAKMEALRERFIKEKELFMEHKKKILEEIARDIEKYELDKDKIIQSYKDYLEASKPQPQTKPFFTEGPAKKKKPKRSSI